MTAILFIIVDKGLKCPSKDDLINTNKHIKTYLAISRNEILHIATMWINRKNVTLTKADQHSKANTVRFYLHEMPRIEVARG